MSLRNHLKRVKMDAFFAKYQLYIAMLISVFAYVMLGYFFEREQWYLMMFLFSVAFIGMIALLQTNSYEKTFFKIGVLYRIIFLFATPALSQDFYRFIWDGQAIVSGINPYHYQPDAILHSIASFPNATILHEKMGALSASHFSNYPPINQLFFALAAFIGGKSILVSAICLRVIIVLADIGIYYYGKKILTYFNKNTENIFWYFLNPLVIVELTGNLHFEGVMFFFFVAGLYFLLTQKYVFAAVLLAVSISVKLLPVLLLPLFFSHLKFKKSVVFYSIIIGLNVLFFLPFLNPTLVQNYCETIALWFINFEFNASIYYVMREIGYYYKGYNTIQTIGQVTPFVTVVIVLFFTFIKKNQSVESLISNAVMILTLYLFISTTVHPWYVINLIVLSVFTKYKFPLVWSFVVLFSYYAYSQVPFKENMLLIAIEYALVFGCFLFEVVYKPLYVERNGK